MMKCSVHFLIIPLIVVLVTSGATPAQDSLKSDDINATQKLTGLEFSSAEKDSMLDELRDHLNNYKLIREVPISNDIPPALWFNPLPVGFAPDTLQKSLDWGSFRKVTLPVNRQELAFFSIRELAELIRTRAISSEELTRLFISRLKKYDSQLHCVITITEELAIAQARKADAEIAAGKYRGVLHGIPYGAKDLLAVKEYKTTWGAMPFKDQYLDVDATVIQKLEKAGAVLVAKLTLGALAWGDVWYGEKTRNPWNLEQGSSGSSAGSASATAAGLVPFAIGSETWGSIVSPSTRCGTTGLRPTYGRVSRYGAMALSWSMDKLGPITRSVEDCAIVFDAIRGPEQLDQSTIDAAFNYRYPVDISALRVGYLKEAFESDTVNRENNQASLDQLRAMGADLIPVELPDYPTYALSIILSAEAAAAFDDLTRSGRDSLLVRQIKNAWPNVFRAARFIPAVEYLQANRMRYQIIQKMAEMMDSIDVYVTPSFGENLLLTNLTGHPCVVVPNGFNTDGSPTSISFIGRLFDEATLLAVAKQYQDTTIFHRKHPPLFSGAD
jgi:Asp-tRNA(Asn)/Glu-tRNA(Gln) amidotransferase A subunit family amidase